jgi:hypothetical protein
VSREQNISLKQGVKMSKINAILNPNELAEFWLSLEVHCDMSTLPPQNGHKGWYWIVSRVSTPFSLSFLCANGFFFPNSRANLYFIACSWCIGDEFNLLVQY